ncbi:MAG: hypothetical protein FKY71_10575 [Spiribacter salinus]|uniref:Uncharacterized protein n=1 Tax=Spiribacter salinus TaxID=1335746 RepID=A0A540VQM6_9GAMM|nr:MAG: hypothetical protein FKY71_10575 [Spiribacter salinus]
METQANPLTPGDTVEVDGTTYGVLDRDGSQLTLVDHAGKQYRVEVSGEGRNTDAEDRATPSRQGLPAGN